MGFVLRRPAAAAFGLAVALGGAGCSSNASDPAALADKITRAVYANDLDGATASMDDATKNTVTRAELGTISDRMHRLGDYQSLAPRASDPDGGKYEYDATFSNGMMLVQLRIDPSGKVGAYRVSPEGTPAASTAPATSAHG